MAHFTIIHSMMLVYIYFFFCCCCLRQNLELLLLHETEYMEISSFLMQHMLFFNPKQVYDLIIKSTWWMKKKKLNCFAFIWNVSRCSDTYFPFIWWEQCKCRAKRKKKTTNGVQLILKNTIKMNGPINASNMNCFALFNSTYQFHCTLVIKA